MAVIQTDQPIEFVSDGAALHSVRGQGPGSVLFHKAVIAGASPAEVVFETPQGWVDVRCAVHGNAAVIRLLTLDHPGWAWTDAAGRFKIPGIPRVSVELRAWRSGSPALSVVRGEAGRDGPGARPSGATEARMDSPL